jgi:hypothetical protein
MPSIDILPIRYCPNRDISVRLVCVVMKVAPHSVPMKDKSPWTRIRRGQRELRRTGGQIRMHFSSASKVYKPKFHVSPPPPTTANECERNMQAIHLSDTHESSTHAAAPVLTKLPPQNPQPPVLAQAMRVSSSAALLSSSPPVQIIGAHRPQVVGPTTALARGSLTLGTPVVRSSATSSLMPTSAGRRGWFSRVVRHTYVFQPLRSDRPAVHRPRSQPFNNHELLVKQVAAYLRQCCGRVHNSCRVSRRPLPPLPVSRRT